MNALEQFPVYLDPLNLSIRTTYFFSGLLMTPTIFYLTSKLSVVLATTQQDHIVNLP